MGSIRGFVAGVAALVTMGCIGSVNPIVPESEGIFNASLLGTWIDSDSSERTVITKAGPHSYAIAYTDDHGQTVLLTGILSRSRDRFILDVQPTASGLGAYNDFVVRLHIALVLDSLGPRTHLAILEPDSLDHFLRAQPAAIAHARSGDGVVLTASSSALVPFLATYISRPGALAKPSTWIRQSP